MLTTSTKGRALDYSRVVGGRLFRGIVYIAVGAGHDIYALTRDTYGSDIIKLTIGTELDDEEELVSFSNVSANIFDNSWPTCAVFSNDRLYVTDELQNRIIIFDSDGRFMSEFGETGNEEGQFDRPSGITLDSDGALFIADTLNHRIQKLTADGTFISSFGQFGQSDGQFDSPWGLETGIDGSLFVADHKNNRVQKFSPEGTHAGTFGDGGTDSQRLDHPSDVAIDPEGDIYVCDWVNNRVQLYDAVGVHITSLQGAAFELSKWQQQYVRGNPDVYKARRRVATLEPEKWFALPTSVAYDPSKSRLLVVDSQRWRIQIFDKLSNYSDPQFNI